MQDTMRSNYLTSKETARKTSLHQYRRYMVRKLCSIRLLISAMDMVFNATLSYIVAVNFIGGGNRKSLTNYIT